ncbi:MAG: sugar phosphate nucleotidyltransferase [Candidatus Krumholzibacteria bacterium]|nr:sugar phosphate nucleotidyltransferase [Candidatus Krumholzibacteria bacterium]
MYAAILAGGTGRRFWPASRAARPKQFLDLTGGGSMLAVTRRRLGRLVPKDRIIVLTVREQLDLVRRELPDIDPGNIFAEPEGRSTAPSLAVACAMVRARGSDDPLLCCPADHLIDGDDSFASDVGTAAEAAASGVLVTFGVRPRYPATGYGYIEAGEPFGEGAVARRVVRFHEKPDREKAARYIETGRFFWNSGIFLWRPSVFLSAWDRHLPAGSEPLRRIAGALSAGDAGSAASEYRKMPSVSVDYGILEKAEEVVVVPARFGWSDVGSWDALAGLLPPDEQGNVCAGRMETIDARGNIIYNPGGLTAAVGIDDIIVAVDGGCVLVCRKGESERVRDLLDRLRDTGNTEDL